MVDVRRIDANRGDTDAVRIKLRKLLLETPQLGVAEWSPKTAIENQDHSLRSRKQIAQTDRLLVLIQQHEVRRLLANVRRLSGERNLAKHVKNLVAEK